MTRTVKNLVLALALIWIAKTDYCLLKDATGNGSLIAFGLLCQLSVLSIAFLSINSDWDYFGYITELGGQSRFKNLLLAFPAVLLIISFPMLAEGSVASSVDVFESKKVTQAALRRCCVSNFFRL